MKVHLDNVSMSSNSGPNSFAKRLAQGLIESGHDVFLHDGKSCDVSIVFIEPSGQPLAKKVVQRLDGIWFSPHEFEAKNVSIKNLYKFADGVIWQSEFDKEMITKWWGSPKKGSVIHNGIQTNPVTSFKIAALEQLRSRYEKLFVCSANWHPQKRLKSNIELFQYLRKNYYKSSGLIVMGSNPSMIPDQDVYFTGPQPHDVCLEVFSACDWMLHLAWLDHCPNTVVESLSQNTPVICAEHGGTKELVQGFGIVLKEKSQYNYELADYDNPPDIDYSQIQVALPEKKSLGLPLDISMNRCLRDYINFIGNL